jgi:hypothetical protein
LIGNILQSRNLSDDIIVFGKDEEEHDKALHRILRRLEDDG